MYEQEQEDGDNRQSVLLKPLNVDELEVYQRLASAFAEDPVHEVVPGFHGVRPSAPEDGEHGKRYLCLDNLLHGLKEPMVMDVKLGMRTHLFSETQNEKPRGDLFKKMYIDFPSQLTAAEQESETVTKSRYMAVRDAHSTTGTLGFRVSGTAGCYGGPGETSKYRATVSETPEAASQAFRVFAKSACSEEKNTSTNPGQIADLLLDSLRRFRASLESSPFVRQHECIGTSVLLVVDASCGYVRSFWIDFAKMCVCPDSRGLSHREPPSLGSQEEGLLLGLDNLVAAWESVAQCLHEEELLREENSKLSFCQTIYSRQKDHMLNAWRCIRSWLEGCSIGVEKSRATG